MDKNIKAIVVAGVLALISCSDTGVESYNKDPVAVITAPEDGFSAKEGETVQVFGNVSDGDPNDTLEVTWRVGEDVVCGPVPPEDDNTTMCEATLVEGELSIQLEVRDDNGGMGSDHITLLGLATAPPVGLIASPTPDGIYYSDQLVSFEAAVSDEEDITESLVVKWTSSRDGLLPLEESPTSAGDISGAAYLSEGEHLLTLTVTDTSGKTGEDTVIITVGPPNSSPTCQISKPSDGETVAQGQSLTFEGTAEDSDVPSDWLSATWKSDKDGELGTSIPATSGEIVFSTSSLSVNSHTITLTVQDEIGATCTDLVLVRVGTPPAVNITSPEPNASYDLGQSIQFVAEVSDTEDTPDALSLTWESDVDGELNTDPADSTGSAGFSTSSLSPGNHAISLTAEDSHGLTTVERVDIVIAACETSTWYQDVDSDGYGDALASLESCTQPAGYVADGSDCDDTDASSNPGAREICNDGVDNDCDDIVDRVCYMTIGAGKVHTCQIRSDGSISCWGCGTSNMGQCDPPEGDFVALAVGKFFNCAIHQDGRTECWGSCQEGMCDPPDETLVQISAGGAHVCGVESGGTGHCWGEDFDGRASVPDESFLKISAGGTHSCGLKTDNTVVCWGDNSDGQWYESEEIVVDVSAGDGFTCVQLESGMVQCVGDNSYGQLEAPEIAISNLDSSYLHTCGIDASSYANCWSCQNLEYDGGQCDANDIQMMDVAAGTYHSCGLTLEGDPICWGCHWDVNYGQCAVPEKTSRVPSSGVFSEKASLL